MTPTPSKPEASLRELRNEIDSIRDRLMVYGISGERLYGIDEWSEPAVRLAKVIERLDALSARDEAGAVDTQAMVLDRALDALLRPHVSTAMQRTNAANYIRRRISELLATQPASGEAGADARRFRGVGELERTGYLPEGTAAEREATPPAASGEVYVDFGDAIGTAGPFPVIEGRVALPKATKDDLCSRLAAVAPAGMVLVPRDTERKARLWDDLTAAKNAPRTDADTEWQRLALTGDKMAAIRVCRAVHGYSLTEARYVVETFVAATPPATAGEE